MQDIKDLEKQITFVDELYSRYREGLNDRKYNEFSDCVLLNASGKNSVEHIKRLGILLRKELSTLDSKLDRTYNP
nr:MAG TPA: hypothetical protein [Bacteriophage sp.]